MLKEGKDRSPKLIQNVKLFEKRIEIDIMTVSFRDC